MSAPPDAFQPHRWQREVEFCSSPVSRGIRGQNRFCLAHKLNITAIKADLIWFVFPLTCSYAGFRGFLVHSLFWALLIGEFSEKDEHHHLASCRAAGGAGRAGHVAEGCSAFPPRLPQRQLSPHLASIIFSSKTNSGNASIMLWPRTLLSLH